MDYLIKFDENGYRQETYPIDSSLSPEAIEDMLENGYVRVVDEDYQYYIGNRGAGKNGTGYIRGKKGKPINAPAHKPTTEEKKQDIINQYESDKDALIKYYADASLHGDTDLMAELKEEMAELDEQFTQDMEKLEG
jgi:hypothetical protein